MRYFLYISFVCLSFSSVAQDWKTISNKDMVEEMTAISKTLLKATDLGFTMKYSSYRGHGSTVPFESLNSTFSRSGNKYYSKMLNMITVQSDRAKIVISKDDKSIVIYDTDASFESSGFSKEEYISTINESVKSQKLTTSKGTIFRISYEKTNKIETLELTVNTRGFVTNIVVKYRQSYEYEDTQGKTQNAKPKLVIDYLNYKNTKQSSDLFNTNEYLRYVKEKDSFTAVGKYAGYVVEDVRLKK